MIDAPLLNFYKSRTDVSEAAWKTERAGYLPKLDLGYSLQSVDGRSGFHGWEAGISVPLLFFSQSGRTKAARINVEIAGQQYRQKELELNAKYSGMLSRYESMLDLLRYYKNEALPLAEEQIGAAYLGYRLGNIDYIQFIQNMESAIKTRQEYLIHLEDYYNLKEQLHYICRKLILNLIAMKLKIVIAFMSLALLSSCKNANTEAEHEEQEHHGTEGVVLLNEKQEEALDLKLGPFQMRNLTTVVKTNGQLKVPPSGRAEVTAIIGGNVKEIKVFEGDKVKKGQSPGCT